MARVKRAAKRRVIALAAEPSDHDQASEEDAEEGEGQHDDEAVAAPPILPTHLRSMRGYTLGAYVPTQGWQRGPYTKQAEQEVPLAAPEYPLAEFVVATSGGAAGDPPQAVHVELHASAPTEPVLLLSWSAGPGSHEHKVSL